LGLAASEALKRKLTSAQKKKAWGSLRMPVKPRTTEKEENGDRSKKAPGQMGSTAKSPKKGWKKEANLGKDTRSGDVQFKL